MIATVIHVRPANPAGAFRRVGEPVCCGLPFPRGMVAHEGQIQLSARDAGLLAVHCTVTERWSDGSIRWVLLDFKATTDDRGHADIEVTTLPSPIMTTPAHAVGLDEGPRGITVRTGQLVAGFTPRDPVACRLRSIHADGNSELSVEFDDGSGRMAGCAFDEVMLESANPLTARIRLSGTVRLSGESRALGVSMRVQFFEGLPSMAVGLTVHNPRRARHDGGIWELGDAGSMLIPGLGVRLTLPADDSARETRYSEAPQFDWRSTTGPLRIYQNSSGGENWNSHTHVTRDGTISTAFQGYETTAGDRTDRGRRTTPIVQLAAERRSLSVTMARFWENFPKSIEADRRSITLGLFPAAPGALHEIQGGERKRHDFAVSVADDGVTAEPLAWARLPLVASAPEQWYEACDALPFLVPPDTHRESEDLVLAGVAGSDSFFVKRETADEYGWRHFGDLPADHEAVNSTVPLVSHYNNQYDPIAGSIRQFLRTGDVRWYELMADLARHVADIDIYHTTEDKAAYNGGLFWHTFHYLDAGKSSHRSYPAAPGVYGGGPSCEHNYAGGLALHYLLTGDPDSKQAVLDLAEWVIAMDDGRRNIFRWLDRGRTGWASATGSMEYHGPGRGAGNSIATLLWAARFTTSNAFQSKAEELIRRCIDPSEDPGALQLLDAERRWSYTVFLQALGRYLSHKVERGELDEHYGYARESLLTYARWMAGHEYPYLDKPDILEYPNETWVVQDLRKAEVFVLGWLCAAPAEREMMRERAEYFFERSITTLRGMPSRTLTRPLVLLMSYTDAVPWMRTHSDAAAFPPAIIPLPPATRKPFVPQRVRAVHRAAVLAAGGAGLMIGGLILWMVR